jgi:DNA (cytosine-5)-methyltransferase 1
VARLKNRGSAIGIDLFAGAGGLSLGADMAGIDVALAVEKDSYAAQTYIHNHPKTKMIIDDIKNIYECPNDINMDNREKVLFGGPPCQGFSYSNQRTRNKDNPSNWLFDEFLRVVEMIEPEWVVFENVCGFIGTENKMFLNNLITLFEKQKYTPSWFILDAQDYGVPQRRSRFFLLTSRNGYKFTAPKTIAGRKKVTVGNAIADLPNLSNGSSINYLEYNSLPNNNYATTLRKKLKGCTGHLVTKNADYIIARYKHIPQGGNWENIPDSLMMNYADKNRCHTGIYHRLNINEPALTIGNYRKAMLIHPLEHRGLSVREAARIQSFPDSYEFKGSIGFQQQQVGNAVPPLLAKAVFQMITNGEYSK